MKKRKFNAFGAVVLTAALFCSLRMEAEVGKEEGTTGKILTIAEVMSKSAELADKNIKVLGRIATVDAEKSLIMLEEAACRRKVSSACGPEEPSGCVYLRMPVKYSPGAVLVFGNIVIISGKVSKTGEKFSFDAVEIVRKE